MAEYVVLCPADAAALKTYAQQAGGMLCALDASATDAAVLLVTPRGPPVVRRLDATALPSESLITTLSQMAEHIGEPLGQLRAIVVGLGPGSYTGLRVGLATAKGLALGSGAGLLGFSSLALLAADGSEGAVLSVRDALRESVYVGAYQATPHQAPRALGPDALVAIEALPSWLKVRFGGTTSGVHLRGDGAGLVTPVIEATGIAVLSSRPGEPNIAKACHLVADRLAQQQYDDLAELVPKYLRASLGG